jgi:flagellar basal body rod protein FlgF
MQHPVSTITNLAAAAVVGWQQAVAATDARRVEDWAAYWQSRAMAAERALVATCRELTTTRQQLDVAVRDLAEAEEALELV